MFALPGGGPTGDFYGDAMVLATDLDAFARYGIKSFREPLTKSVRTVIIPSIRTNFAAQGRPAWAPLAPATVLDRGASGPILDRKGRLLKVATQFNIWSYTKDSATITGLDSRVKYAKYHQSGTRKMPQRAFVLFQDEDEAAIERIFYEFVDRRMRKSRL